MKNKIIALAALAGLLVLGGCTTQPAPSTEAPPKAQTETSVKKDEPKKEAKSSEKVIDKDTGLIKDDGMELVAANCSACHSLKLVTQSSGSKQQWTDMIRYMQKNQGLWDLGEMEKPILEYLAKNYAPVKVYRRAPLKVNWRD